jgi:hypothetical protein
VALAGKEARKQAIQAGCIPPLLELVCFGADAAADAAAAAMWQLTSANDGECVCNPLAHERGGCRVVDPKEHGAAGLLVKSGGNSLTDGASGTSAGAAPGKLAAGARWWSPPVQPCVRLLKVMNEARDDDRAACLHAVASFCVPSQLWLRAADVKIGDGSKADWW